MTFLSDYELYINKLLDYLKKNSGKHDIDKQKATKWINAQPLYKAKIAAKQIIKFTKYVTFIDIINYIEKLIITQYKKIQETTNDIYMFVGEKHKSNYFISMLGLYFMKKYNMRLPSKYMEIMPEFNDIENYNFDKIPYIIYIDDMTYSGAQINRILMHYITSITLNSTIKFLQKNIKHIKKIKDEDNSEYTFKNIPDKINEYLDNRTEKYKNTFYEKLYKYINNFHYYKIEFLLLGSNKYSLAKIHEINERFMIFIYKILPQVKSMNEIPFKIDYNITSAIIYKTLDELCSEEELFYIYYYFSPGLCPNMLLYYDHKIADIPSTLSRVLNYGIIVPNNYNLANYWKGFVHITNPRYKTFNFSDNIIGSGKFYQLCAKYYWKVKNTNSQDIHQPLKFIPFINSCNTNILHDKLIKKINYLLFMSLIHLKNITPINNYKINDKYEAISFVNNIFFDINDLLHINFKDNEKEKQKIFEYLIEIDKQRCDMSFYKTFIINNNTNKKSKKKTKKIAST